MALGSKGGTISNPVLGVQMTFVPGVLPDDAVVILQPADDADSAMPRTGFELLGKPLEIAVHSGNAHTLTSFSSRPMRVCFNYTDEQLAQAGQDVNNLVVLQSPGTSDESEVKRNKAFGTRRICVDVTDLSTYALAARVPDAEKQIILVRGLLNVLSLVCFGGSAILAVLAYGLKVGWLR